MQLEKGVSVYFEREINNIFGHWLRITSINKNIIRGTIDYLNLETSLHQTEILRVIGDMNWNIKNLNVSISQMAIRQKSIGYFVNLMHQKIGHFGRFFYASAEIYKPKASIEMTEVPLWYILGIDANIEPYLDHFCYFGCVKKSDNYLFLDEEDIADKDRAVFLSSFEIE